MEEEIEKAVFRYASNPLSRVRMLSTGVELTVPGNDSAVLLSLDEAKFVAEALQQQKSYADLPSGVAVGDYGTAILIRDASRHHIILSKEAVAYTAEKLTCLLRKP